MDLTVIVCTHNRATLLEGVLSALAEQATAPGFDWEVLLVDNNSSDGTRAVFERAVPRLPIRYVFEREQGLSHARNTGVKVAHGQLLAFTDDDVVPARNWVGSVAFSFRRWDADIVGGRVLPKWESPPPDWLEHNAGLLLDLAMMTKEEERLLEYPIRGIPQIFGANMAFRREVFPRAGFFDTRLGVKGRSLFRGEESELIARAVKDGAKAVYDPSLVVFHRVGENRMRRSYFRRLYFERALGEALAAEGSRLARWRLRRVLELFGRWIGEVTLRRPTALELELELFAELGAIWGGVRQSLGGVSA